MKTQTSETVTTVTAEIAIIDSGVEAIASLVAGLRPGIEAIVLESSRDGITQIGEILAARPTVRIVHIFAHGSPGCLYLGDRPLDLDAVERQADALRDWFPGDRGPSPMDLPHASIGPYLVLYGCNVATGRTGGAFVARLQTLTGARVAASSTAVGYADRGGNWQLALETGSLPFPLALRPDAQATYAGLFAYSEAVLADNPIAYWRLNEAAGPIAQNLGTIGGALNGTYTSGPTLNQPGLLSEEVDPAVDFSAGPDFLAIPDHPALNSGGPYTERTLELWFRPEVLSGRQVLYEEGGGTHGLNLFLDGDRLHGGVWRSQTGQWLTSPRLSVGQIYHAVLVYDGGQLTGYLNGTIFDSTATAPISLPAHTDDIGLARVNGVTRYANGNSSGNANSFNGRIDEVAIYGQALDADRVAHHYAIGTQVTVAQQEQESVGAIANLSTDGVKIADGTTAALTFASPLGSPVERTLRLENLGDRVLEIASVDVPPGFRVASISRLRLLPQQAALIGLVFEAQQTGTTAGNVVIRTNAANTLFYNFPVEGSAIGPLSIAEGETSESIANEIGAGDVDLQDLGDSSGDRRIGGPGSQVLRGGAGNDTLLGNAGEDVLEGYGGSDRLWGGRDSDYLLGGDGDDWLSGDRDEDTLIGGLGADTFAVGDDFGRDVILDFDLAEDALTLIASTDVALDRLSYQQVNGGLEIVLNDRAIAWLARVSLSEAIVQGLTFQSR